MVRSQWLHGMLDMARSRNYRRRHAARQRRRAHQMLESLDEHAAVILLATDQAFRMHLDRDRVDRRRAIAEF